MGESKPQNSQSDASRIVVIGAGIVGASVAYHLSRLGAPVTLIDRSLPASGVTGTSFAWIGKPTGNDKPDVSTPLRNKALDDWRRLTIELPRVHVRWHGSISWGKGLPPEQRALAFDEGVIDASRVREIEPALRTVPQRARHNSGDGAVDPVAVTEELVRDLLANGGEVLSGVAANALELSDQRVTGVKTSAGVIPAETVVIAAGADTSTLLAPVGIDLPVEPSPALLLRFNAPDDLVRTLINGDEIEARQDSNGVVLVAAEYRGEANSEDLVRTAQRMRLDLLRAFDVESDKLRLIDIRVGMRPMPVDGLPIVGQIPTLSGAYVAVMHSGITLAPVVGRLVASELVEGKQADELNLLRPFGSARGD